MVAENLNNNMLPVGTTVHINPEDIKWEVQSDLISREALKKSIKSYADDQYAENEYLGEYAIMNIIDNAPTVEYTFEEAFQKTICENKLYCPNKRTQGEWKETGYETGALGITYRQTQCSNCGWEHALPMWWNFCPNCGAEMRKGGAE